MKRHIFAIFAWITTAVSAVAVSPSGALPVLYINTENGAPVVSKEDYINATYYLDPMGIEGVEAFGSKSEPLVMTIKGRGNYTWTGFEKKPYRLKLDKKAALLGMNSSKHFVLMAGADDDQGFLRNPAGYELSRLIGLAWTPEHRPVDVVLNGDYRGLYMLTENIRVDKDRVNIFNQEDEIEDLGGSTDITGGWLVEIDNYEDPCQVTINEGNGDLIRITYKSPEEDVTEEMREFLRSEMRRIDATVYDRNPESKRLGEVMDIESLARFYVVQEIMEGSEAFHGSWYLHRDRGEGRKWICGPVWDFGNTFRHQDRHVWENPPYGDTWIDMMVKNQEMMDVTKREFKALVDNHLQDFFDYLENRAAEMEEAAVADRQRWQQYTQSMPGQSFRYVKNRILERVKWLANRWDVEIVLPTAGMASDYWLRGTHSNWDCWDEWNFTGTENPAVFEIRNVTFSQDGEFKVADRNWSSDKNWGAEGEKRDITVDEPMTMICGGGSQNIRFKAGHYAVVRFEIKDSGTATLTLLSKNDSGIEALPADEGEEMPMVLGNSVTSAEPFDVYGIDGRVRARGVKAVTLESGLWIVRSGSRSMKVRL